MLQFYLFRRLGCLPPPHTRYTKNRRCDQIFVSGFIVRNRQSAVLILSLLFLGIDISSVSPGTQENPLRRRVYCTKHFFSLPS
ncbi:uncharacterized protein L3040_001273 [Drepanopeziza brunnea f. sp. 'multigermtubi']|uniref:uncharacterized protein n=1 Tax=Drepanopeziza brunnea f. sp. 'multigermtubi' TaxID=698441 RepID=UPI002399707D|nr:hypothetical protein L3040_001273 [Drepanopeziza brunnea f. sp. 'multigermtubi']